MRNVIAAAFLRCHVVSNVTSFVASVSAAPLLYIKTKYFRTMYLFFWIHVHERNTSFYTVVYVNTVHRTAEGRWTLLFCKVKKPFLYVHQCVFILKGQKMSVKESHWVSMYSSVYSVSRRRTSWVCFYASFRLSCWAQMFHPDTHLLSFVGLFVFLVVLLGPRSLHSPRVCRV